MPGVMVNNERTDMDADEGAGAFFGSIDSTNNPNDVLTNFNYAIGPVNLSFIGYSGFQRYADTGNFFLSVLPNYYNSDTTMRIAQGEPRPTIFQPRTANQLRSPTAPNASNPSVYSGWSAANWDFGNTMQYPTLKYTTATDVLGSPACRDATDTSSQQPVCGTLINPRARYGLSALTAGNAQLSPQFDVAEQNSIARPYFGTVTGETPRTQLIATTFESATYSVYIGGIRTPENTEIASGTPSAEITLSPDRTTEVVIEVHGTETVRYTLYLDYQQGTNDRCRPRRSSRPLIIWKTSQCCVSTAQGR